MSFSVRFWVLQTFNFSLICNALRDLILFVQFKKNVKNTHGEVLLLVKLQAEAFIRNHNNMSGPLSFQKNSASSFVHLSTFQEF